MKSMRDRAASLDSKKSLVEIFGFGDLIAQRAHHRGQIPMLPGERAIA